MLLSIREVADRLNLSVSAVYALKNAGLIAVIRRGVSKGYAVDEAELERFVAERTLERRKEIPAFPKSTKPTPGTFTHLNGARLLKAWESEKRKP